MENQFEFIKFNEDGLPVYSKNNAVEWHMSQGMSWLEGIEMVENEESSGKIVFQWDDYLE